jgi:hypothetical protein
VRHIYTTGYRHDDSSVITERKFLLMHQKRTITARMLWTAPIMLFMFVSFFATPAILTHASANGAVILKVHRPVYFATPAILTHASANGAVILKVHRPVYKDSAKHAVSGDVIIDHHPERIALICVALPPGKTTTLDTSFLSLKLNDNIKVYWYTDNRCKHRTSSPKPYKSQSYKSQSYKNDHSPYTINFP